MMGNPVVDMSMCQSHIKSSDELALLHSLFAHAVRLMTLQSWPTYTPHAEATIQVGCRGHSPSIGCMFLAQAHAPTSDSEDMIHIASYSRWFRVVWGLSGLIMVLKNRCA